MSVRFEHPWDALPGAALPVAVEVLRRGPVSRAEIGRRLGLSHASLSRLSAPLIERGILIDAGERSSGRAGRPSRLLDVDASSHHFLGVKISANEIVAAVTDLRGDVRDHVQLPIGDRSERAVVEQVRDLHASLSGSRPIAGIGIGIGGEVSSRRSVVHAEFLGWRGVPLAELVENATGAAVLVENDVVALCEYEGWFGSARHDERFAVITLGVGTGFGLVVNGRPVVGDGYGRGLVGHWPMDPFGPLCPQGHRGCAAALLNSDAIERHAGDALGRDVTFDEVVRLAEDGQPAAKRIISDAARGLGALVAAVCNLTLPQRIVIAGEAVHLAAVGEAVMREAAQRLRPDSTRLPPIDLASGDNVEWARGAAVLAIQAFALGTVG